jgi:GDP-L-fucose synthase
MIHYSDNQHINVGTGSEVTILEAAELVCDAVEYTGTISRDETKPDGTPRKLMDSSRLFNLGWGPKISLRDGLAHTYQAYLSAPLTLQ